MTASLPSAPAHLALLSQALQLTSSPHLRRPRLHSRLASSPQCTLPQAVVAASSSSHLMMMMWWWGHRAVLLLHQLLHSALLPPKALPLSLMQLLRLAAHQPQWQALQQQLPPPLTPLLLLPASAHGCRCSRAACTVVLLMLLRLQRWLLLMGAQVQPMGMLGRVPRRVPLVTPARHWQQDHQHQVTMATAAAPAAVC